MKVSTIVLVALCFSGAFAAPRSHRHLAVISAKQQAVAPQIHLPSLINAISQAVRDIGAALARADASLAGIIVDSQLLDQIAKQVVSAEKDIAAEVQRAARDALNTPVKDLPALAQRTLENIRARVAQTAENIQSLVQEQVPELVQQVKVVLDQLLDDVEAALQPLIDLIQNPRIGTNGVSLPDLIAAVDKAAKDVANAVKSAAQQLENILKNSPVLQDVEKRLTLAAEQAKSVVDEALAKVLNTPIKELPQLVKDTAADLQAVAENAARDVQEIVERDGPQLAEQVKAVLAQLKEEVRAAVQPVLDLIGGSSQITPRATLPDIIDAVQQAAKDINKAVEKAAQDLQSALEGSPLIPEVTDSLKKGAASGKNIVAKALRDLPTTPVKELPALVQRTVEDLEAQVAATSTKIEQIVRENAPELAARVQDILDTLKAEVSAAVQRVVDLIKPPGTPAPRRLQFRRRA